MKRIVLILIVIISFLGEAKSQKVLRYGVVGGFNSTSLMLGVLLCQVLILLEEV